MSVLVSTSAPDDNRAKLQVIRVADVARTANQIGTLLNLTNSVMPFLIQNPEVGTAVAQNDEAAKSARETYLLAQTRLRDLVDDQARWGSEDDMRKPFEALQASQRAAQEAEAKLSKAKVDLLKSATRPCVQLAAKVAQLQVDGEARWVCWFGPHPQQTDLVGVGRSAEEAMRRFDERYTEQVPERSLEQSINEPLIPTGDTPSRKTKKSRKPKK
jgi:hypothetical protein